MQRPIITSALVLTALSLFTAACGDDSTVASKGAASSDALLPTTATVAASTTTSAPKPTRIVSLAPTLTEMLFAVGAGPQVIAVDDQSNYPADAPKSDLSGFTPNVEAIAAKTPDLVVLSDDIDGLVAKLGTLKIATLVLPAAKTLDETFAEIEQVGAATGHVGDAAEVVLKMKTRIDELVARVPKTAKALTYYHELDNTLFSVTSKTFIGEVYTMAGLANIADAADKDATGYPQLSAEYLVNTSPDLVFLADTKCCKESAKTFGARPGFDKIAAVKNGAVIELDDDIASRWGPRTPDLLEAVVNALEKLPVAAAT
jgi:iron complex transport system substrate-binding protein